MWTLTHWSEPSGYSASTPRGPISFSTLVCVIKFSAHKGMINKSCLQKSCWICETRIYLLINMDPVRGQEMTSLHVRKKICIEMTPSLKCHMSSTNMWLEFIWKKHVLLKGSYSNSHATISIHSTACSAVITNREAQSSLSPVPGNCLHLSKTHILYLLRHSFWTLFTMLCNWNLTGTITLCENIWCGLWALWENLTEEVSQYQKALVI